MQTKWISEKPRTLAIIFDTGEEVMAGLTKIAKDFNLSGSRFTAIGAFQQAQLGFFDPRRKDYTKMTIREQMEVLSLLGDIAMKDGEPQIHAHVVVGLSDTRTRGGHLLRAVVRPTLEVMLTESPVHLQRIYKPEVGLALIDLQQSQP